MPANDGEDKQTERTTALEARSRTRADTRVVRVNLETEILRLAAKDGITDPAMLGQVVSMTRRDNYANVITSYYQGYDIGYAAGLSNAAKPIIAWVRFKGVARRFFRSPVVAFILGVVATVLIMKNFFLAAL